MKPLYSLNINALQVPVALVDDFVCGSEVSDGFVCDIALYNDSLNSSGFVTDVVSFISGLKWVYSRKVYKASCEELAAGIVNFAQSSIGPLKKVNVGVYNKTGSVIIKWKEGDEVPPFPREATWEEKAWTQTPRKSPAC